MEARRFLPSLLLLVSFVVRMDTPHLLWRNDEALRAVRLGLEPCQSRAGCTTLPAFLRMKKMQAKFDQRRE